MVLKVNRAPRNLKRQQRLRRHPFQKPIITRLPNPARPRKLLLPLRPILPQHPSQTLPRQVSLRHQIPIQPVLKTRTHHLDSRRMHRPRLYRPRLPRCHQPIQCRRRTGRAIQRVRRVLIIRQLILKPQRRRRLQIPQRRRQASHRPRLQVLRLKLPRPLNPILHPGVPLPINLPRKAEFKILVRFQRCQPPALRRRPHRQTPHPTIFNLPPRRPGPLAQRPVRPRMPIEQQRPTRPPFRRGQFVGRQPHSEKQRTQPHPRTISYRIATVKPE